MAQRVVETGSDDVVVERRRFYGDSPLNTIVSLYLLIGFLVGVYVAFIAPGAIPGTLSGLLWAIITVLIYMLLWPFFLFGGLHFRLK